MARRDRVDSPREPRSPRALSQSSFLDLYEGTAAPPDHGTVYALLPSRAAVLTTLSATPGVDILIIGEGPTAVGAAHQLALSGVRVALISEHYFGIGNGAWALLRHRLDASGSLKRLWWRWCLHRFMRCAVSAHLCEGEQPAGAAQLLTWLGEGCAAPWSQPFDERLLVRETVLAARQEGAVCVANTELLALESEGESGCYVLTFRDRLGQGVYRVRAGAVLADPHLPQLPATQLGTRLGVVPADEELYEYLQCEGAQSARPGPQRGQQPITLLPDLAQCAVWSREAAGVTEVLIPLSLYRGNEQRRAELLSRLLEEHGVAGGGVVHRRTVRHSGAAGVVQRGGILWAQQGGPWGALPVIQGVLGCMQAARAADERRPARLEQRRLAGSFQDGEREAFIAAGLQAGVSLTLLKAVAGRWGGRVREIAGVAGGFEEAAPGYLRGEVALAYWSDQASSEDDFLFGSLSLQRAPNWRTLAAALGEAWREFAAAV